MGANPTIYCLEKLTDYDEFERLCVDLMSLEDYPSIEPLGGTKDKGRDALYVDESGKTTIFAFSVKENWRAKLSEDGDKIKRHHHSCETLVFITTSDYTVGDRDEAIASINNVYGWKLELYGIERLRNLLDVRHPEIKSLHPQIFPPQFLGPAFNEIHAQRDHILISYAPKDSALSEWLARKLTAEGYLVWCESFKSLDDERYPEDIDIAIRDHVFGVVALYSHASLADQEVMRQRASALTIDEIQKRESFIALNVDGIIPEELDRKTRVLRFISFQKNWAFALGELLQKLESVKCPKLQLDGQIIATKAFFTKDVLSPNNEILVSNCLCINKLPDNLLRFKVEKELNVEELRDARSKWAFRYVRPNLKWTPLSGSPSTFVLSGIRAREV